MFDNLQCLPRCLSHNELSVDDSRMDRYTNGFTVWKEKERGLFQYNVPENLPITSMSGHVCYFTNECQAF